MPASTLLFLGLGLFELIFVLIPVALTFGLAIWALIDVIRSNFEKDINKIVWILVIIGMPFLGGILYYFIGTKQKVAG
jgi:hypothetical protein